MRKIKMQPKKKCRVWHRWQMIKNTGINEYHECKDCGARLAIAKDNSGCYQPFDIDWVVGNKSKLSFCVGDKPNGEQRLL